MLNRILFQQSSAQVIAQKMSKLGVKREQIQTEHLSSLYTSLPSSKNKADFTNIIDIFPHKNSSPNIIENNCVGVIIETRTHPLLEKVVIDFVNKTNLCVQLYHGTSNLEFIQASKIAPLIRAGKVILTALNINNLYGKDYNAVFLSKQFWQSVIGRGKIFVFQTDSVLCDSSKFTLDDFITHDYIGAWWSRKRPIGLTIDGGNGGFSLRDWHKSMECLERFSTENWPGGEDGYFAFHIELIGGYVGKKNTCSKFATQEKFTYNSYGCHQISCLNKKDRDKFLKYCPESKFLL
jgi:hypothetical protein